MGPLRHDQLLVAMLKVKLQQLHSICIELADTFLQRAKSDDHPMPGYTHIQKALVYGLLVLQKRLTTLKV